MSAIAGICHWDGRPVSERDLQTLASHSRVAGPDGGGAVSPIPGLVLQAHQLHFDRLSTMERQPFVFDRGSVLTFDGRLDNRDDLLIRLHHDLGPDITDAAIVAAAFARWGLDCLPSLIGDWSLAIWDAAHRRIILARDYMGNRPLYYLPLPGGLAWATSLDALAECFGLHGTPDETYIAARLTDVVPPDFTPFRGAMALRAGHLLVSSKNASPEIRRYWALQPTRIRYRRLQDYADHARELMAEAVRVRLRLRGRVWSHLSGGFDSSSIVCLASALIKRQCVEASSIQTLSVVSSDSPESDESPFINAVERWCGVTTIRREPEARMVTFEELLARRRPFAYGVGDTLEAPMAAAGDRVLFSGEGGDLMMIRGSAQIVSLLEALHEGRPLEFLRLCLARAQRRHGQVLPLIVRVAMQGYLPALTKERRRKREADKVIHSTGAYREPAIAERVTPELLARAHKPDPRYPSVAEFPIAKRALAEGLYGFADHPATTSSDLTPEIWITFPFTHRPLAEFMIGVPQLAFWDAVISRAGMKRALSDVLPPEILTRSSKGDPRTAKARNQQAIAAEYARAGLPPEPPIHWQLVTQGYLRLEPLAAAINAVMNGIPASKFLRQSVNVEAWLRSAGRLSSAGRSTSTPPTRELACLTSVHR